MLDLYGIANGFGWKMNEIIGAQIVSVPMTVPIAARERRRSGRSCGRCSAYSR